MIPPVEITSSSMAQRTLEQTSSAMTAWMLKDIMLYIFSMLSGQDAAQSSRVCRVWKQLIQHESLWNSLLRRDFPYLTPTEPPQLFYQHQHLLNSNITKVIYHTTTIQTNDTTISSLIFTKQKQLVTGSHSNTIKIWDLNTGVCENTLQGYVGKVTSLILTEEGNLIIGSLVGPISIWDLNERVCIHTLRRSRGGVATSLCLALTEGGLLISGCMDGAVRICDLNKGIRKSTFQISGGWITALIATENQIVAGGVDGVIYVWNLNTGVCEKKFQRYRSGISSLAMTEQRWIISGFYDGVIKIWDLNTGDCERTLQGHVSKITSLIPTKQGQLISASLDCTIRIWDLKTYHCIHILQGSDAITSLILTEQGQLISGSAKGKIKIRDFAASSNKVFQELAELFEKGDCKEQTIAMERFLKMPEKHREKIYEELCKILNGRLHGEHAFRNQSSDPKQKAQAIRNYLKKA